MGGNGSSPFDYEKIRRMCILLVCELYWAGWLLALACNAEYTSSNPGGVQCHVSTTGVHEQDLHRIRMSEPSSGTRSMYATSFSTKATFLVKFKH